LIANATYSRTFDLAISDPDKIAAAWDTNLAAPAIAFAVGDNRNLLALSALRADSVIYTLGNFSATTSIEGLYEEGISYLGSLASTAKSNNIVASDKVNQIRNLKLDVSGVSTDEEFTNLISFQKAYQGSARLVKMADDLLAEILNLL